MTYEAERESSKQADSAAHSAKKPPHQTVKNNCIGSCVTNVIQPTNTGLIDNLTTPADIVLSCEGRNATRDRLIGLTPSS